MPDPRPAPTLRALTGLRFVAAFHVLLLHTALGFARDVPAAVGNVVRAGATSGSLVFVLSGFILAYRYLDADGSRPIDRRAFWWARVARVYPVYLFALLFALPAAVGGAFAAARPAPSPGAPPLALTLAANATLLQGWLPSTVGAINPPGWSLSVEALCYLLFPALALLVAPLTARRAAVVAGAAWLLSLAAPALYLWADARGLVPAASRELWTSVLRFNPLLRFPEFLIGVLAGRIFAHRRAARRTPLVGPVLSLGAAAAVLAVLGRSDAIPAPLLESGLLAPLFAALVVGLALGGGPLAWLLARSWMVLLGEASYALYLIHMRLAQYTVSAAFALVGPLPALPLFLLYVAVTLAASVAVLLLLEEPARRFLRRATRPTAAGPAPRPAAASLGG
jgi:peptidoglycan/LPS O-acetylase OafA/YrhL